MSGRYLLSPKADRDLDDQAFYLAAEASVEVGHRFLVSAHETFALLATQPEMGWRLHLQHPDLIQLRVFPISHFENILLLYLPRNDGVDILRVVHGSRDLRTLLLREGFLA